MTTIEGKQKRRCLPQYPTQKSYYEGMTGDKCMRITVVIMKIQYLIKR